MQTNGLKIRQMRIERGVSLARFATAIGLSGAGLSRIERGSRSPRPETLLKIAVGLGCRISDITIRESATGNDNAPGYQPGAPVQQHTSTSTSK
ncbi:helix-turn-helix domain-containing protein [Actinacidiphila sp. ITFR-21]|uniref:helix-turn-helix domain-containing protein n=1 Tax=Actinacidiphila sp. ITFR-21 TaxID=3075199 RepID=UPI002889989E|nr:helix-turn-helix transcriptional regulator [Streptomyces sp. ITFR-21]WNI16947.1 helix-turn-helix transcriptional regulator [Streptomyces sp. ITFR-21]